MSRQSWQETLIVATEDGPTLVAAAAASMLPSSAKKVIPPNFLEKGTKLLVKASGRISSVITTPGTARFDLRLGGVVVWDSLAILLDPVAAHVTVGWTLDLELTCRVIGSAANIFGQGSWACEDLLGVPAAAPKGALTAILPWDAAPAVGANFDSTAAQLLDMFFTQTVATGSLTLHQYDVCAKN